MGKKKAPPGTWVERDLFRSKAFIELRGAAPQVLILFLGKRDFQRSGKRGDKKVVCANCNSLNFTYIEALERYGITKSRFARAIDELLAKGFIEIVHQGGGCQRDMTVYALSDKWRIWRDGAVIERREIDTVKRGFCKPNKSDSTRVTVPIYGHENVP